MRFGLCAIAIGVFVLIPGWGRTESRPSPHLFHVACEDGRGHQHTVAFGFDNRGTDGFDIDLGEYPLPPPPPPGTFDFRLIDRPGMVRVPGSGSYVDIRKYNHRLQVDTFFIRLQVGAGDTSPRLEWDAVPEGICDSLFLERGTDKRRRRLDTSEEREMEMENIQGVIQFAIITYGARP